MTSLFNIRHGDTHRIKLAKRLCFKCIATCILVISFYLCHAQSSCGFLDPNVNLHQEINGSTTSPRSIQTVWHIVRPQSGAITMPDQTILTTIDEVVDEFETYGINLKGYCLSAGQSINYIYDDIVSSFVINPSVSQIGVDDICALQAAGYCNDNHLDVFLLDGAPQQLAVGVAITPGSICVIDVNGTSKVFNTIMHEIGHCFGLLHTNGLRGFQDLQCNGGPTGALDQEFDCNGFVRSTFVPYELVNGSNASISGDFVVDTEAAIAIGTCNISVDQPCTKLAPCLPPNTQGKRDPNCQDYQHDANNFLFPAILNFRECDRVFTPGQASRMKGVIETYLDYMLWTDDTPQITASSAVNDCPALSLNLSDYFDHNSQIASATIVFSTDNDPSDGVDPIIDPLVFSSGHYYAYNYYPDFDCYSDPSAALPVSIVPCCESHSTTVINNYQAEYGPKAFGGDVVIANGGTLVIGAGNTIYMGEGTSIVVEEGGQLILEQYAGILPCDDSWEQLVVHGSIDAQGYQNRLYGLKEGVRIETGATASLLQIDIEGTGDGSIGLYLGSNSNSQLSDQIKVAGYNTAIEADNVGSYLDLSSTRISECLFGIRLDETPAAITDADIETYAVGIIANNSPGCLIEDNYINSVASPDPSFIGTSFDRYGSIYMFRAGGSILRYNTLGTPDTEQRYGIILIDSYGGTIDQFNSVYANQIGIYGVSTDFRISQNEINYLGSNVSAQFSGSGMGGIRLVAGNGNQVNHNYVTASNYAGYGISTVTSQGTEISNNDVDFDVLCCDDRSAAINSLGSNDETVRQNYVSGSRGVLANNTAGNTYECNVISHTHNFPALGILYNSLGQRIRDNSLQSDADDLLIRSAIGEQHHHGNTFSGAGERVFAEDLDIALDSRFYVNSGIPFHMPVEVDPVGWFVDQDWINNYYECAQSPGQGPNWIPFWDGDGILCSHYNKVVEDHGYGSRQYIRMIQTMLRYDKQRPDFSLSDCIIGDPVLPACWDKLTQAEKLLLDRHKDEEGSNEGVDALSGLVQGISAAYKVDSTASTYVLQHQEELVNLSNEAMENQYQNATKIQVAEELLAEIDCSDSIIAVVLPIMLEYVKYLQTEEKDTFDYSSLITYSRYCADDYGPYIHLARALVSPYTDENFASYDDCRTPVEERSIATVADAQVTIYPNPSTGRATLDFGRDRSGHIIVRDISGIVVSTQKFSDQLTTGLLLNKAGLYLIQVAYIDGSVETIKHIVTQ